MEFDLFAGDAAYLHAIVTIYITIFLTLGIQAGIVDAKYLIIFLSIVATTNLYIIGIPLMTLEVFWSKMKAQLAAADQSKVLIPQSIYTLTNCKCVVQDETKLAGNKDNATKHVKDFPL